MIKSVTNIRLARNAENFEALLKFFDALGLERREGWRDESSRGVIFNTVAGAIGVVEGQPPCDAYMMLEVTDLDTLHGVAVKKRAGEISGIIETHWGSRLFYAQPVPGVKVAFWQNLEPERSGDRAEEGSLQAAGLCFGIVLSRFNAFITERLLDGALEALRRAGAREEDIGVVRVPGAFEIPIAAREMAATAKYDAVICLGCILRGETSHYQHLADEVTRGIGQSAQETGVPHAYGVLTCDTLEQAIGRAGLKSGNKGAEAALSAVEMVNLAKGVRGEPGRSVREKRSGPGPVQAEARSLQQQRASQAKRLLGLRPVRSKAGRSRQKPSRRRKP